MFRQSKKRVSSRRNFSDHGGSQFVLGSSHTDAEKALYDKIYESKLSFYEVPPQGEITLDQFEMWAIDRLKVLLELESCISRNKTAKEIETIIKAQFQKLLPFNTDNFEEKKKDYYSHFILRLCFCRSKELRAKFVRAETMLFKIRFNMLTSNYQTKFVQSLNLPMLQFISEEEKTELSQQLYQTVSPQLQFQLNITDENQKRLYFQQEKFIKLAFENVIELVGSRQVFLKKGYAYLPQFQQLNLLAAEFANRLEAELIKTYQYLPRLNEDDRLIPILQHLSSGYTISDYDQQGGAYGAEDGEFTAKNVYSKEIASNYPLCVKNLFAGLKQHHHLRYNGRQQLSLFLKGIGLSMDEALKFWSEAFTAGSVTSDKFNKEYRYNFRHNYGLEGARINYRPWDCRTILSKPRPARGEYHGCPYRDWNVDKLSSELGAMQLTQPQINSVLDSCHKAEYTVACTKVFECTHGQSGMEVDEQTHIAHPNLYFERSRQLQKKEVSI
ncbi:PRI2 (YKL045W) [Zygosaccharomyces parabailii]|uniref:DNA primase large subunit n=1 Tax=Zygosaccharomyces bailii (strain CLIB 213 / ATCC 58445 / CBS 680 / BCRC 21525 / NBRC 1098 / NCYC 1416 / NRRL Y-2227) TaxID=1333698 RepID=A0A8J2TAU6_ZYGB2|nr:PRI2 (YKL045W) [Zygosaccharomyces parabailii]CDF92015.1 ZYBA0S18-00166g1_1 [Zygosaccharomyces bailii CLIB 213]CDH16700.1 probable PRI2-DNA-directed DNA polymerase alpha, 58 KD subunit (DNA primase) [Zygosaccharomyces bailii ISA1307]SJM88794.1 probable DNA primase large subunit [Zygosaccharomyces bailii]